MNYERIISDRRTDSHQRKVHIVAGGNDRALCGRQIDARWRKPARGGDPLCRYCEAHLNAMHHANDAILPPATTDRKAAWKIMDKIGGVLRLTEKQNEVIEAMKKGGGLPKQVAKLTGLSRQTVIMRISHICRQYKITPSELREVLPVVAISVKKSQDYAAYPRRDKWQGYVFHDEDRHVYVGTWDTKALALAGAKAYAEGRIPVVPPNKHGGKPLVQKTASGYQVRVYDPELKKRFYIGACKTKEEGIAMWQEAKQNGVYISGEGIVKL